MKKGILFILLCVISDVLSFVQAQPIVANHFCTDIEQIPSRWIDSAQSKLVVAYGHTSHGSQLVSGMEALLAYHGSIYNFNSDGSDGALTLYDYAMDGDAGYYPEWENNTYGFLGDANSNGRGSNHPEVNVIMWSWCGQASEKSGQTMIDEYLAPMSQLERVYPGIKFVYMTGHLDGSGVEGDLNINDQQIRTFCLDSNKILFDFMDIECYDPSGTTNYLPLYANDFCDYDSSGTTVNWAEQWMAANAGSTIAQEAAPVCTDDCCAHSQGLNCVMKGRAVWWLWARLAGWNGLTGIDQKANNYPEVFTLLQNYPNPFNPTTTIDFSFAKQGKVTLKVYDLLGHEVAMLVDRELPAGILYSIPFHASHLASGVYFYQLKTANSMQMKKMLLMK